MVGEKFCVSRDVHVERRDEADEQMSIYLMC